jgi:hypothetical protein
VGSWRTDEWNPVFIAPVFTALGDAFAFGGARGRRELPLASGLLAVAALAVGLFAAGRPGCTHRRGCWR